MRKSHVKKNIVLSIKEAFADLILTGEKTVELRRKFPHDLPRGTIVYVYASGGAKSIIGQFEIQEIFVLPLDSLWNATKNHSCVSRDFFFSYFSGVRCGVAIRVGKIKKFSRSKRLSDLFPKKINPRPPQSFCYLEPPSRYEFDSTEA